MGRMRGNPRIGLGTANLEMSCLNIKRLAVDAEKLEWRSCGIFGAIFRKSGSWLCAENATKY
jgi:hypothetical protein